MYPPGYTTDGQTQEHSVSGTHLLTIYNLIIITIDYQLHAHLTLNRIISAYTVLYSVYQTHAYTLDKGGICSRGATGD